MSSWKDLKIVKVTDEGNKLRVPSQPIKKEDLPKLGPYLVAMAEYILIPENKACGMALSQIGLNYQGFVVEINDEARIMINAEVKDKGGREAAVEGCLSIEGVNGDVSRPRKIEVSYYTFDWKEVNNETDFSTLELKKVEREKHKDWHAREIMHEKDHDNGILFIDKALNLRNIAS